MVNFYIYRLQSRLNNDQDLQSYLDTTVPRELREAVRTKWNSEHPENLLS